MSRLLRVSFTALAAAAVLAGTAVPASASVIAPTPIGPKQYFVGLVNGHAGTATIQVGCFGPIHPGQTGHPLSGQTVEVRQVSSTSSGDVGFTGSAGTEIVVSLGSPTSTATPIILHYYGVPVAIPTSLTLPCGGFGKAVFTPEPGSDTAKSATVTVEFASQP
ncbi:MAG TPA: hypothetical protein VFX70_13775 [Mycobacteriales bacterium]|nr:hypothetical protein [Mycobacteriales bacterium]